MQDTFYMLPLIQIEKEEDWVNTSKTHAGLLDFTLAHNFNSCPIKHTKRTDANDQHKPHFRWRVSYHDYISRLDRDFIVTPGLKGIECSVIHHFYILLCRNRKWAFFCL